MFAQLGLFDDLTILDISIPRPFEYQEYKMAFYYELPVYRDVYKLILMIFECTKDFSKEYKYTLGQDMKRDALQLVRNIYRANKSANKKEYLVCH